MMIAKANQLFGKLSQTYTLEQINSDFAEWLAKQTDLSGGERAYNKIDEKGRLYQSVSMAWPNKKKAPDEYFLPLIHPKTKMPCPIPERGWRNPPQTMELLMRQGLILFGEDEKTQPRRKYLLEENMYENIPSLLYYGGSDTAMLSQMEIPFDTPKVVDIVKEHIQSMTERDSIILDFFAGSATTAHAVMQLNAEDGGNRKFIMVQLPEETAEDSEAYMEGYVNICEIGKERIRRAGKKIKAENPNAKNFDIGFRVFKCEDSNYKDVAFAPKDYSQDMLEGLLDNIKEGRSDLDLLFDCMLRWGVELSMPLSSREVDGCTIHNVNDGDLVACFDGEVTEAVIDAIAALSPVRVVFRDSSFNEAANKMNLYELFKQKCDWTDEEVKNNIRVI